MGVFELLDKHILKFVWRSKDVQIAKSTLKRKERNVYLTRHEDRLQRHSNKNSVVLVQKQINIPKKESRLTDGPRNV